MTRSTLDAAFQRVFDVDPKTQSFADFGKQILDIRELEGVEGVRSERSRWSNHVEPTRWAKKPIAHVTTAEIATWRRALGLVHKLAPTSVSKTVSIVNVVFGEAVEHGLRKDNPVAGLVRRRARKTEVNVESEEGDWSYLRPHEQEMIFGCEEIPEADRLLMAFAWSTGLRQGEQWNLRIADLHVDGPHPYVFVRYGSRYKSPKSSKARRVPLGAGLSLKVAKRWLELLPTVHPENPNGLVFPAERGGFRHEGAPRDYQMWLAAAGVDRHLRWHDLRHTCGSSLANGWWGVTLTPVQLRDFMGHSTIAASERYWHTFYESLAQAVKGTSK